MSDVERPFGLVALLDRMGVDAGLPAEEVGRALGASRQEVVRWRTWGMDHAQAGALAELNGLAFSSVWKRDGTAARPGRERQPAGFVEPTPAALAEVDADAEQPEPESAVSTPPGDPPEPLRCPWQYQPGAEPCGFAAKGQQGLRTHLSLIHKVRGHSKAMVAERARLLAVAADGGVMVDDVGAAGAMGDVAEAEQFAAEQAADPFADSGERSTCDLLVGDGIVRLAGRWHHDKMGLGHEARPVAVGQVIDRADRLYLEGLVPDPRTTADGEEPPCCVNLPPGEAHHPSCPSLIVDAEIVNEDPPAAEAVPADPFRAALTALDREHDDLERVEARLADELEQVRRRRGAIEAALLAMSAVVDG